MIYGAVTAKLMAMGTKTIDPGLPVKAKLLSLTDEISRIKNFLPDNDAKSAFDIFCLRLDLRVEREKLAYGLKGLDPPYSPNELALMQKRLGDENFTSPKELDEYYHKKLRTEARRNQRDGKLLTRISGIEADLYNISAIYRLKTYYNTPAGAIYPYLLNVRGKLSLQSIQALAESADGTLVMNVLATPYGKGLEPALRGGERLETAASGCIIRELKRMTAHNTDSLARAMLHVYLRENTLNRGSHG